MKYWTLERFEEGIAILENVNGEITSFSKELLPDDAQEGDVLSFVNCVWQIDKEETDIKRAVSTKKFKSLFKKV